MLTFDFGFEPGVVCHYLVEAFCRCSGIGAKTWDDV